MFKVEKARSCTILSSVPSFTGRAAIGYDHGYVGQLFYLGLALDPAYIEGFIEVLRLRRARRIERQQIKWPAYTAVVAASGSVLTEITSEAIGLRWLEWLGFVVVIAALAGFPISIGIAIVRFRLYEIDTLINRTLVYGSLTVMLALVYFGGVTATQAIFRAFTPQEQQPQLVIVI